MKEEKNTFLPVSMKIMRAIFKKSNYILLPAVFTTSAIGYIIPGIIGVEFNEITTTLGALESKRTSANPNFAAVLVDLLLEADLEEGDKVAMNLSSSFPALNIASIVACETLDLEPVIISSIGSSSCIPMD